VIGEGLSLARRFRDPKMVGEKPSEPHPVPYFADRDEYYSTLRPINGDIDRRIGEVVRVPLGSRDVYAYVVSEPRSTDAAAANLRDLTAKADAPRAFDWIPALPLESGNPIHALEEMLTKLVLFGLLGVIVAAWRLPPRTRRAPGGSVRTAVAVAGALGLLASGAFESSQRWYNTHTPCVTDALLGGLGAALGVLIFSRAKSA